MVAAGVLHGRSVRLVCEPCELTGDLLGPGEGEHLVAIHDRLHHGPLGQTAELRAADDSDQGRRAS